MKSATLTILREELNYVDLIPISGDYAVAIEAAFVYREYASFKTFFGDWIQAGDN